MTYIENRLSTLKNLVEELQTEKHILESELTKVEEEVGMPIKEYVAKRTKEIAEDRQALQSALDSLLTEINEAIDDLNKS